MGNCAPELDAVFRALGDSTRRSMLTRLAQGSATIGELGEPHDMGKPAVTKHIKVLERAGLLTREVDGRVHRCNLDPTPLTAAQKWVVEVRAYWDARLDDLGDDLESLQKKDDRP